MREGISLAMVPGSAEVDSRDSQLERAAARARSGPRAAGGEAPLRSQSFLLGGEIVSFVDLDGSEPTDVAEIAAFLDAIQRGQAVTSCLSSMSFSA